MYTVCTTLIPLEVLREDRTVVLRVKGQSEPLMTMTTPEALYMAEEIRIQVKLIEDFVRMGII
jgi:hypothetical protein